MQHISRTIVGLATVVAIGLISAPTVVSAQCVGPQKTGKTLGLYEVDARSEGVLTGAISGRVPIRKADNLTLDDSTPGQFDVLTDCDGSESVVWIREIDTKGRVLLWFSLAWLALLIGGLVGGAAGGAVARRQAMRSDREESAALPIVGALVGAMIAAVGVVPPMWITQPGTAKQTIALPPPPQPVEEFDDSGPVEMDPKVCLESAMCKRRGACGLVDGECGPTEAEHCEDSEECTDSAACTLEGGKCVVAPEDCEAWSKCAEEGICGFDGGSCTASEEGCRSHPGCKAAGACSVVKGKCAANSDEDCRQSDMCRKLPKKRRKECHLKKSPLGGAECTTKEGFKMENMKDIDPSHLGKFLGGGQLMPEKPKKKK